MLEKSILNPKPIKLIDISQAQEESIILSNKKSHLSTQDSSFEREEDELLDKLSQRPKHEQKNLLKQFVAYEVDKGVDKKTNEFIKNLLLNEVEPEKIAQSFNVTLDHVLSLKM